MSQEFSVPFRSVCLRDPAVFMTHLITVGSTRSWVYWRICLCCCSGFCMVTKRPVPLKMVQAMQASPETRQSMSHLLVTWHHTLWSSVLDAPPSFCDMGNAISSLIAQASGGSPGDGAECVLLCEEHSLILTCCWVSLKASTWRFDIWYFSSLIWC